MQGHACYLVLSPVLQSANAFRAAESGQALSRDQVMRKSLVRMADALPAGTLRNAFRIALLGTLWAASVSAQVDTGSIVGTVLDPSGAPVPAAKVVIENTATMVPETVTTDSNGQYVALLL